MDPREIPLRDLHLPESIGWWPPAPGWWLLIAIAVAGLVWIAGRYGRRRTHAAARRQALRRLESICRTYAEQGDAVTVAREISALLRRAMLAYAPRSEVAGLTGEDWLRWLDRDLDEPAFAEGPGRHLLDLPYRDPATAGGVDVDALLAAARRRLRTPVGSEA